MESMLHRAAGTGLLLAGLLLAGCKGDDAKASRGGDEASAKSATPAPGTEVVAGTPVPGSADLAQAGAPGEPVKRHGEKWQNDDDDKVVGGFSMFKEAWVYVDGKPIGVMREVELPPIEPVWVDEVEYLDFKAGDPGPHERVFQVRRWRLSDYLAAAGVDLKKINGVYLHGGRGVVNLKGDVFRRFADGIHFDLTGNTDMKLRIFLPGALRPYLNTSFDRYAAVSVTIDKPYLKSNEGNDLVMPDGTIVEGIPFYGQPLRGGVRVYLDGRLALVIKRNSLGDEGRVAPGKDEWNLQALLTARGHDVSKIGAIDWVDDKNRVSRLGAEAMAGLSFAASSAKSGSVTLSTGGETNAVLLWSDGKVPEVRQLGERERDKPAK